MLQDRILDKNTPIPLYFQLERLISEEIENGNYPPGSMIPTEEELSQTFDISRTTVRQAIAKLVQQEKLYRIKSKGTFVSQPKVRHEFIQKIQSFDEEIRLSGRTPRTEVLQLETVRMPEEISEIMGVPLNSKAVLLYRKRCADEDPIVRVKTYLPYDACSFVLDHDFSKASLYQVLSTHEGTRITRIVRICEACLANAEDVSILGVKRGRPIHHFISQGFNQEGKMLEYSIADYRGDRSSFRVELTRS